MAMSASGGHRGRHVGHADRLLEKRRLRAAGDHADRLVVDHDGIAVPGDRAVVHLESDEPARDPGGLLRGQGLAADEVAFGPGHDPLEIGLEHAGGVVDVVAVQPHRRLEAQRVARAQACRAQVDRPAGVDQRVPHARGVLRRHEHLVAVFTGVAGARDGRPHSGDLAGGEPVVLHPQIGARQGLQHLARGRPLHGNQGIPRAGVDRDGISRDGHALRDPGKVLLDVRGVDDEQEVVAGETVDEQVVDEGAALGRQGGVLGLADRQPGRVVARDALDPGQRVASGHLNLAHVADVEQARARAHGQMLVGDAAVLDRHLPATERDHAGAHRDVAGVQRRATEGRRLDLGHETRVREGRNT